MAELPPIPNFQLSVASDASQPLDELGEREVVIGMIGVIDGRDAETVIRACVSLLVHISATVAGPDQVVPTAYKLATLLVEGADDLFPRRRSGPLN